VQSTTGSEAGAWVGSGGGGGNIGATGDMEGGGGGRGRAFRVVVRRV
jgi:hypothetical protein